jgi:thiamine kinase-like enzyme
LSFETVALAFFGPGARVRVHGSSPGSSSSGFAEIRDQTGTWCLRRWDGAFDLRQLRFTHQLLETAHANGFTGVPIVRRSSGGSSVVLADDGAYEVLQWLSGAPISGAPEFGSAFPNVAHITSPELVADIARSLAELHNSLGSLEPLESFQRPLSGCLDALPRGTSEWIGRVRRAAEGAVAEAHASVALSWLNLLPEAAELAASLLLENSAIAADCGTICHRDLWPAHVLVRDDRFVGFVDFERAAFSAAIWDVAQLVAHFNGWPSKDLVFESYSELRALGSRERRLLPAAAALDLILDGQWMLNELYAAPPTRANPRDFEAALQDNLAALEPCLRDVVVELRSSVG